MHLWGDCSVNRAHVLDAATLSLSSLEVTITPRLKVRYHSLLCIERACSCALAPAAPTNFAALMPSPRPTVFFCLFFLAMDVRTVPTWASVPAAATAVADSKETPPGTLTPCLFPVCVYCRRCLFVNRTPGITGQHTTHEVYLPLWY